MLDASTMRDLLARFGARTTTANAVYETLKHCIVEGSLNSGERLLSDDLATRLGVSRTPVREALRKLEAGGYVSAGLGHGLVVREYNETDLEEVFLVRELLEGAAARLAAETISRSALDRLSELLDEMQVASAANDVEAFRRLSGEFHTQVFRASRNAYLIDLLRQIQENVRRFSATTLYSLGRMAEALAEHRSLAEALRAHDGDAAERLAREHRRNTLRMRRDLVRRETSGDPPPERAKTSPPAHRRGSDV